MIRLSLFSDIFRNMDSVWWFVCNEELWTLDFYDVYDVSNVILLFSRGILFLLRFIKKSHPLHKNEKPKRIGYEKPFSLTH